MPMDENMFPKISLLEKIVGRMIYCLYSPKTSQ